MGSVFVRVAPVFLGILGVLVPQAIYRDGGPASYAHLCGTFIK